MPTSCARIVPLRQVLIVVLLLTALIPGCKRDSTRPAILEGNIGPSNLALRGRLIFDATPFMARPYAGNFLSCGDCHIQSGTVDYAAPMIDVADLFPRYSQRTGRTITLVDRIQECFVRSENGAPPPASSPEMLALVAYIDWLSRAGVKGQPYKGHGLVRLPALTGSPLSGKEVYASRCKGCHGSDGAGMPPTLPPLWGPGSFNDGAQLSHTAQLAAFVQHNMPEDGPRALTPQQAFDVAAYIETKPRPKFNRAYQYY